MLEDAPSAATAPNAAARVNDAPSTATSVRKTPRTRPPAGHRFCFEVAAITASRSALARLTSARPPPIRPSTLTCGARTVVAFRPRAAAASAAVGSAAAAAAPASAGTSVGRGAASPRLGIRLGSRVAVSSSPSVVPSSMRAARALPGDATVPQSGDEVAPRAVGRHRGGPRRRRQDREGTCRGAALGQSRRAVTPSAASPDAKCLPPWIDGRVPAPCTALHDPCTPLGSSLGGRRSGESRQGTLEGWRTHPSFPSAVRPRGTTSSCSTTCRVRRPTCSSPAPRGHRRGHLGRKGAAPGGPRG